MNVLILGGDGYLGWPTAMNLSRLGHQVTVADNYLRRQLCQSTDSDPLFEVPNLQERSRLWKELSGYEVQVRIGDLNDWDFMSSLMQNEALDTIVHYAEQPSAPYSMLDRTAADLTSEKQYRGDLQCHSSHGSICIRCASCKTRDHGRVRYAGHRH